MFSPPPLKPPRGVKQGKETSGLLMSVIRTLSASETNEQREKERLKLEKEYKKSDARLDELVAEHAADMLEVMKKFTTATTALNAWGQKSDGAVARLTACRSLLQLRRDDLKRLWTDARTHHYALQMLTDIERVVISEREAREAIAARRVLSAATTLSSALKIADTSLAHVDALHNTRQHLECKKTELVDMIIKDLNTAVYSGDASPLTRQPSARRRTALLLAELTKHEESSDALLQEITPEWEGALCEEDRTFGTVVAVSLEALGVLDQLAVAAEKFKVDIQNCLLEVIDTVSKRIIEEGDTEPSAELEEDVETPAEAGASGSGRAFARLFACLSEEFRSAAVRNSRLIQLWRAAMSKFNVSDACLHTEQQYWSAVQQVLQLLLTEYLDIDSVSSAAEPAAATPAPVSLEEYFAKKKTPQRARLYTLPVSSTLSAEGVRRRARAGPAVCRGDPALLYTALPAVRALVADIEAMGGGECSLRVFVSDYVRSAETERIARRARGDIADAVRDPAAWRDTVTPPETAGLPPAATQVCSAAAGLAAALGRAAAAARLSGAGARAVLPALGAAAAAAARAHATPSRRASHRWLADDDIVRFLKSLPNWRVATATEPITEDKHLEQELQDAYTREAEILGSSLGDGVVARAEIVTDAAALGDVAIMCESMSWLKSYVTAMPAQLTGGGARPGDKLLSDIAAAAAIFEEIEHKCLLFLHLEVRIQCFHYLGAESAPSTEDEDAARLARALAAFTEHAAARLAARRRDYVLNGIGEMVSAGVVYTAGAGAAAGRLARCLAALPPAAGLRRARRYLSLLELTPPEIIASIKEKGPQFSELEYLNAIKIVGAQRGLSDGETRDYFRQINAALGHVGVTV